MKKEFYSYCSDSSYSNINGKEKFKSIEIEDINGKKSCKQVTKEDGKTTTKYFGDKNLNKNKKTNKLVVNKNKKQ